MQALQRLAERSRRICSLAFRQLFSRPAFPDLMTCRPAHARLSAPAAARHLGVRPSAPHGDIEEHRALARRAALGNPGCRECAYYARSNWKSNSWPVCGLRPIAVLDWYHGLLAWLAPAPLTGSYARSVASRRLAFFGRDGKHH